MLSLVSVVNRIGFIDDSHTRRLRPGSSDLSLQVILSGRSTVPFLLPYCQLDLLWATLQAAVNLAVRSSCHLSNYRHLFVPPVQGRRSQSYEPLLLENEREAVADLLQYLESMYSSNIFHISCIDCLLDRTTTNFFTGSPLSALTTLSFSDNVDLQRSAALAFAEITEKEVRQVGRDTLDPILFLLSSHDTEVQRAASAALGNLAVNSVLCGSL